LIFYIFYYFSSIFCFFFFSSRRRHTRSKRDWSSDVCSSDLTDKFHSLIFHRNRILSITDQCHTLTRCICYTCRTVAAEPLQTNKIGRASCRERVETTVGDGA